MSSYYRCPTKSIQFHKFLILDYKFLLLGLYKWLRVKNTCCPCRRCKFSPQHPHGFTNLCLYRSRRCNIPLKSPQVLGTQAVYKHMFREINHKYGVKTNKSLKKQLSISSIHRCFHSILSSYMYIQSIPASAHVLFHYTLLSICSRETVSNSYIMFFVNISYDEKLF